MWTRTVVVACAATLGACSSSPDDADVRPTTNPAASTTSTPIPPPHDPTDPRPLLTFAYWSSGPTLFDRPNDLPTTVVYPDGAVWLVSVETGARADVYRLDETQLGELVEIALSANLTGGGLQEFVPLPAAIGVEDGARGVFTFRDVDTTTVRVVDQPWEGTAGDIAERIPFIALNRALNDALLDANVEETVDFDRWAIVSRPVGPQDWPSERVEWTGPDFGTLDWTTIDGARCAVIVEDDWPYDTAEHRDHRFIREGEVFTRRPLLPHETSCVEVDERRQLLHAQ